MNSEMAETNVQIMGALIGAVGKIAHVLKETLDRDELTAEDRQALKRELAVSIQAISAVLEQAKPGAGEQLTRSFYGR
jgi:hypothetical protein